MSANRSLHPIWSVLALLLLLAGAAATGAEEPDAWVQRARAAALRGEIAAQIEAWSHAGELYRQQGNKAAHARALLHRGEAFHDAGNRLEALRDLNLALQTAREAGDAVTVAKALIALGYGYASAGRFEAATRSFDQALQSAQALDGSGLQAAAVAGGASLLAIRGQYDAARPRYNEALDLARRANDSFLTARILVALTRLEQRTGRPTSAQTLAKEALQILAAERDSHEKAYGLIALAGFPSGAEAAGTPPDGTDTALAYRALVLADKVATAIDDARAASYAQGYMARLYETGGRFADAMQLTRRAIFHAQRVGAPDLLRQWHAQAGRLHTADGDLDAAIEAYRWAAYNMQQVRSDLVAGYRGQGSAYRDVLGPLFLKLADLLLRRAPTLADETRRQSDLIAARNAVEQLKAAELQDYFLDECVAAAQARSTGLDDVAERTAVFYPILLPERTELLLSLPGGAGIRQYTLAVPARRVTGTVRRFRRWLERFPSRAYLGYSKRLYDTLLRPLEPALREHDIETLVFVPDGPLRTVPMAALHDGERFLIERYAIATTPGLTLTDSSPLIRADLRILLTGLTESVQGFPPLPAVADELAAIQQIVGPEKGLILKNDQFVLTNVKQALSARPFSVVHIASHGQFESDIRRSFLLTYQERMDMNRLEEYMNLRQFSDDPVELLTLSACQTAAGDDRAALGLAGVAIKAGARSALGTLWFINDQASSILVTDFYRELQKPANTKATALRNAQLTMLGGGHGEFFRHPSFWAPFLLIGNWL